MIKINLDFSMREVIVNGFVQQAVTNRVKFRRLQYCIHIQGSFFAMRLDVSSHLDQRRDVRLEDWCFALYIVKYYYALLFTHTFIWWCETVINIF